MLLLLQTTLGVYYEVERDVPGVNNTTHMVEVPLSDLWAKQPLVITNVITTTNFNWQKGNLYSGLDGYFGCIRGEQVQLTFQSDKVNHIHVSVQSYLAHFVYALLSCLSVYAPCILLCGAMSGFCHLFRYVINPVM